MATYDVYYSDTTLNQYVRGTTATDTIYFKDSVHGSFDVKAFQFFQDENNLVIVYPDTPKHTVTIQAYFYDAGYGWQIQGNVVEFVEFDDGTKLDILAAATDDLLSTGYRDLDMPSGSYIDVLGTNDDDVILGGENNNYTLIGSGGEDVIYGGYQHAYGGNDDDIIYGGVVLDGGTGNDILYMSKSSE